jgi:hypothetical protein
MTGHQTARYFSWFTASGRIPIADPPDLDPIYWPAVMRVLVWLGFDGNASNSSGVR